MKRQHQEDSCKKNKTNKKQQEWRKGEGEINLKILKNTSFPTDLQITTKKTTLYRLTTHIGNKR